PFFDAKPEIITSLEFGVDWRFFDNRLGLDFTYYNLISNDQYIRVDLDPSSPKAQGKYTSELINAGEITNKGVELTLSATPIRTDDLQWTTAFNFAKNTNKIVDIGPDHEKEIGLGSSEGYTSKLVEGGAYNDLYVLKFLRDDQGRILFDAEGKIRRTNLPELIGNLDPDWSLGWNNNISYKRFNLGMLINGKFGGKVFSQPESMLDGAGVSQRSADARDAGGVTVNGINEDTGAAVTTISAENYYRDGVGIGGRNGIGEAYVYDRTNIRLSQLSLGYEIDVAKLGLPIQAATLSFIGNNLFFFSKKAPFDPELAMSTSRDAQGLDNFNLPSTGTYGFNLKVTF